MSILVFKVEKLKYSPCKAQAQKFCQPLILKDLGILSNPLLV
jgi:hypothetical protein